MKTKLHLIPIMSIEYTNNSEIKKKLNKNLTKSNHAFQKPVSTW